MDLNLTLGFIVLAVVVNAILYGICLVQWFNYYTARFEDPWHIAYLLTIVVSISV